MTRLRKLLPFALGTLTVIVLAPSGCTSANTSTKGQLISCSVSNGKVANCHPMTAADKEGAPGTCQDVDEDGDGEPGDTDEETADDRSGSTTDAGDKDRDGTPDSTDQDDDNDDIPDVDDCDNEPGGDNPAGGAHD